MRAAKVQASLRIRAVSPEPSLLAHTCSESRGTFRQKARSLAPLNGWACAVKICHDGMLEDTKSLDAAQLLYMKTKFIDGIVSITSWNVNGLELKSHGIKCNKLDDPEVINFQKTAYCIGLIETYADKNVDISLPSF